MKMHLEELAYLAFRRYNNIHNVIFGHKSEREEEELQLNGEAVKKYGFDNYFLRLVQQGPLE